TVLLRTRRSAGAGLLELHATNLQIAISATMPAGIRAAGEVAIPARELGQLLKRLPNGSVTIAADDVHVATFSQGPHEVRLAGIPPDDFPLRPGPGDQPFAPLAAASLRHAIGQVLYAAIEDISRGALTAVQLFAEPDPGRLELYAQDRYRLASTRTHAAL